MRLLDMGLCDAPQNTDNKQPHFFINPYLSNIAVFGGPMTGKTTFIKTLLVRLCEEPDGPAPNEHIYILDFSGNIGNYGKLGNVCAIFDNSNEENIKRVFKTIKTRLEENTSRLDSQNYYSVLTNDPARCPDHITLIIENVCSLLADERYINYQESLMQLCRDGLSKGLMVVITANDMTGTSRLLTNFGQKIAFEMPSDNYYDIFNTKVTRPMKVPGRCLVNMDSAIYECQMFLPFAALDEEEPLKNLIAKTTAKPNPYYVPAFPKELTKENIAHYVKGGMPDFNSRENVVIGLDYYSLEPVGVDIADTHSLAIYGRRDSGKITLLSGLIDGIVNAHPDARLVFFDDPRDETSALRQQYASRSVRCGSVLEMIDYLIRNGYIIMNSGYPPAGDAVCKAIADNPFTVFIIHAKSFYLSGKHNANLISWIADDMFGRAEKDGYMFIFSDTRVPDHDLRSKFNTMHSAAFLLDNIAEFAGDKGLGDKSVFGSLDPHELKTEYAKCSLGDGYFYDLGIDELKKVKLIKFR